MVAHEVQRYALIAELNKEWARLVGTFRDQLPWTRQPLLADCRDLAEVLAAIRYRPDPVLGALLAASAAGDALAGRTVLQAMLGKMVRLGQAHRDVGVDEFVSALWCRIRTYPLANRPTSIAANLALDARKDVLRSAMINRRERAAGRLSDLDGEYLLRSRPGGEAHDDPAGIRAQRVLQVAEATGLIDADTAAVLRTVYLDGMNSRIAAARHQTSPGMIRYRCSRGLRVLARHASALDEAA